MRKNIFAITMLLALTLSGLNKVNVLAEETQASEFVVEHIHDECVDCDENSVEPMSAYVTCPKCTNAADKVTSDPYDWTLVSQTSCSHYNNGYDLRYKGKVDVTISCPSCGYYRSSTSYTYNTECAGFN